MKVIEVMKMNPDIFIRDKPVKMLILLLKSDYKECYAQDLAKEIDITYSYMITVLSELEKRKYVVREKKGAKQILTLTKTGRILAERLEVVFKLLRKAEKTTEE
jgi:DNA-binding MarR family transcriptional regulator|tara:strand:+ start:1903 stop:2214 length:312 start_codon:yes stop_codon:yes gene_type:complete